jgi:murein peptide amidase A
MACTAMCINQPTLPRMFAAALVALAVQSSGTSGTRAAHAGMSRVEPAGSAITRVLGHSVEHRPILATLIAPGAADRSMLVVGSIAGDEPGGTAVAAEIASLPAVPGVRLWLIPDMNPDGAVRGTRVNADGVDLNRNFPFRWRPLADIDSRYYPGIRSASEPESRAVEAFISRVRPGLTIWIHQPYGLVDDSQGPRWAEELLSRTTGLPLARLADYPGSAIGWEDHLIPGSAFDLELPGGQLSPSTVHRFAEAIRGLARTYATHQSPVGRKR